MTSIRADFLKEMVGDNAQLIGAFVSKETKWVDDCYDSETKQVLRNTWLHDGYIVYKSHYKSDKFDEDYLVIFEGTVYKNNDQSRRKDKWLIQDQLFTETGHVCNYGNGKYLDKAMVPSKRYFEEDSKHFGLVCDVIANFDGAGPFFKGYEKIL